MTAQELAELYATLPKLLEGKWSGWYDAYLAFVERVQGATHDEWMTAAFQERLWESDEVTGVGMGTSVVVRTAFEDREIASALWDAREQKLPDDADSRGEAITAVYEKVLRLVTPKHNARRPSAKLVRALAGVFPFDVLCLVDDYKTSRVRSELGLRKQGEHFLRQQVRVREELGKVTGAPKTREEAIRNSMLAWRIYEHLIGREEGVDGAPTPSAVPEAPTVLPTGTPLRLWPREQQYLGINHVQDAMRVVYAMVRDAENGISRSDLITNVQREAPWLKVVSAKLQISIVRERLGLLELHDGDVLRPTSLGRQLLDGETASNVLAPVLLRRVWGFAQVLDLLRRAPSGVNRATIRQDVNRRHGSWESSMTCDHILAWCRDLELIDAVPAASGSGATFALTDAGVHWANRLPANLSEWDSVAPSAAAARDAEVELAPEPANPVVSTKAFHPSAFDDVRRSFDADSVARSLVLPPHHLELFHAALHATPHKRFALLSGLSGSGKTSFAEAYSRAYCAAAGVASSENALRVPVSPDWSDPSGLLGYISPLAAEPTFHGTQALELVLRAVRNPSHPYFLCLDEMNLARVEYYFAPFLSAMEGPGAFLQLHGEEGDVDNVPANVPWPRNLFIIGTVNMDETTHPFSDKVLDRAFLFELWDVDIEAWWENCSVEAKPSLRHVFETLRELHDALRPARRHFGYRVCDEVLGFCSAVPAAAIDAALDAAVFSKVLPKVRGDDSGALTGAVERVIATCEARNLPRSADKSKAMLASLSSLGVVRFSS